MSSLGISSRRCRHHSVVPLLGMRNPACFLLQYLSNFLLLPSINIIAAAGNVGKGNILADNNWSDEDGCTLETNYVIQHHFSEPKNQGTYDIFISIGVGIAIACVITMGIYMAFCRDSDDDPCCRRCWCGSRPKRFCSSIPKWMSQRRTIDTTTTTMTSNDNVDEEEEYVFFHDLLNADEATIQGFNNQKRDSLDDDTYNDHEEETNISFFSALFKTTRRTTTKHKSLKEEELNRRIGEPLL